MLKESCNYIIISQEIASNRKRQMVEAVYSIDGQIIPDEEKPEKFITFIKWQLNIADEMIAHGSVAFTHQRKLVLRLHRVPSHKQNISLHLLHPVRCVRCAMMVVIPFGCVSNSDP